MSKKAIEAQKERDEYCLEQTGLDYNTLSFEQKAEISARFIMSKHVEYDENGAIQIRRNYDKAGDLEPEIISSQEYNAQLEKQYKNSHPERKEEYDISINGAAGWKYLSNDINRDIPYYSALFINGELHSDAGANPYIAEAVLHNPKVLEYIPKEYFNEEVLKNIALYMIEFKLEERYFEDWNRYSNDERQNEKFPYSIPEPYEKPTIEGYFEQVGKCAEKSDAGLADGASIYKQLEKEMYKQSWKTYFRGGTIEGIAPSYPITHYEPRNKNTEPNFFDNIQTIGYEPGFVPDLCRILGNEKSLEVLTDMANQDPLGIGGKSVNNEQMGKNILRTYIKETIDTINIALADPDNDEKRMTYLEQARQNMILWDDYIKSIEPEKSHIKYEPQRNTTEQSERTESEQEESLLIPQTEERLGADENFVSTYEQKTLEDMVESIGNDKTSPKDGTEPKGYENIGYEHIEYDFSERW